MADVITHKHWVIGESCRVDRSVSLREWVAAFISTLEKKREKAGMGDTDAHERIYKTQTNIMENGVWGSYV